jgi:hypothetical protein
MIGDPLLWVLGILGVTAAARSKKDPAPGADFGKDAEGIPNFGILTPQRQQLHEGLMVAILPPDDFREAAKRFEAVGLRQEAEQLRARAKSREVGLDVHDKRRAIVAQCLDSGDPMLCEEGAEVAEKLGMTLAAKELRNYAQGLRERATLAIAQQPAAVPVPAPPASAAVAGESAPAETPAVGVWDGEDERAKGWDEDGFVRHAEK